jgi:hypothetical protein
MNTSSSQFSKGHVRVIKDSALPSKSEIKDVSKTWLHRATPGVTMEASLPGASSGVVARGRGVTTKEAFNVASTKRAEAIKSGTAGKAQQEYLKQQHDIRREQVEKGNPNYKPIPLVKINTNPVKGK